MSSIMASQKTINKFYRPESRSYPSPYRIVIAGASPLGIMTELYPPRYKALLFDVYCTLVVSLA